MARFWGLKMHSRQTHGERTPRKPRSLPGWLGRRGQLLTATFAVLLLCAVLGPAIALGGEFASTFPPRVVGPAHPHLNEVLQCRNGDWQPPPSEFAYQWVIEGNELGYKSQRQSILAATLTLKKEYENKEIWCDVAPVAKGTIKISEAVESENSIIFGSKPPPEEPVVPLTAPAVTPPGKAKVGETLSCSQGTWKGTSPKFAYKWLRDAKEPISGATSSQHTVVAEDSCSAGAAWRRWGMAAGPGPVSLWARVLSRLLTTRSGSAAPSTVAGAWPGWKIRSSSWRPSGPGSRASSRTGSSATPARCWPPAPVPILYNITSAARLRRGPIDVFNPQGVGNLPSTFAVAHAGGMPGSGSWPAA